MHRIWGSFSPEIFSKQRQILVRLLKSPQNRECADCKWRYPRWASVDLGIFICMKCARIHDDLAEKVDFFKVRSATLDQWLPEEVTFIQTMGNERADSYWEAELPPNYDRVVDLKNFIRDKYKENRWVRKGKKHRSRRAQRVSNEYQRSAADQNGVSSSETLCNTQKNHEPPVGHEQTESHEIDEDATATIAADFISSLIFDAGLDIPPNPCVHVMSVAIVLFMLCLFLGFLPDGTGTVTSPQPTFLRPT